MISNFGLFLVIAVFPSLINCVYKYGCTYVDHEYNLGNGSANRLIYANTTIEPLQLTSEDQLAGLVTSLKVIYNNFLRDFNYNTMEDYLELFENYKSFYGFQSFHHYFKNYRPKFRAHVESTALVAQLLNEISIQMLRNRVTIAPHIFMAAGQEEIEMNVWQIRSLGQNFLNGKEGEHVTNVFAVVKFMLRNRLGHILLDSGYAIPDTPLVIMHDGHPPPLDPRYDHTPTRQGIKYTVLSQNPFFLIGKIGLMGSVRSSIDHLIYLGHPYCSILEITKKLELLRFDRYLVNRFRDGTPRAGIYFHNLLSLVSRYDSVKDASSKEHFTAFIVSDEFGRRQELKIPYSRFNTTSEHKPVGLQIHERLMLEGVATRLRITINELYTTLERVFQLMVNNNCYLILINRYAMELKKQSAELYIKPMGMPITKKQKYFRYHHYS